MNTDKIRILVADDHPVVRQGLRMLLNDQDHLEVVAEANNGQSAYELYLEHRPAVAVLDIQMPVVSGVLATEMIVRFDPQAKVLLLTTFDGDEDIFRGLRAGAQGYLLKEAPLEELVGAITTLRDGGKFLSSRAGLKLAERCAQEGLTDREAEVLRGVAEALSNRGIALRLGVSEGTIKSHLNSILGKLRVKSRIEAALAARRRGFWRE